MNLRDIGTLSDGVSTSVVPVIKDSGLTCQSRKSLRRLTPLVLMRMSRGGLLTFVVISLSSMSFSVIGPTLHIHQPTYTLRYMRARLTRISLQERQHESFLLQPWQSRPAKNKAYTNSVLLWNDNYVGYNDVHRHGTHL